MIEDYYRAFGLYLSVGVAVLLAIPAHVFRWLREMMQHEEPHEYIPRSLVLLGAALWVITCWPVYVFGRR